MPTEYEIPSKATITELQTKVGVLEQAGGVGGGPHTHPISDVTGLQTALDSKVGGSHSHAISDVSNLQTSLDAKAASSHSHVKANISDFAHVHPISEVTNLQTTLDGKAASSHTHVKANITDFAHTHLIADTTNLQSTLDAKVQGVLKSLTSNATSTVIAAAATNLSFPVLAGEVWVFEFNGTAQCSGTGGMKYSITAPTGSTIEGFLRSTTTTITTLSNQRLTAINTLGAATHTVANVPAPDEITARVKMINAGTVAIAIASTTAGQTSTLFAGAFLRAYKATEV